MQPNRLKLALGPVLYYWPREDLIAFYRRVADWPVDIVYLGETLCAKRRALSVDEWLDVAKSLEAAGKEVVLSTLALLEAESELATLRRICDNGRFVIEANDLAAVQLAGEDTQFVAGPGINIYNPRTVSFLAHYGLMRWVLPVELSRDSLAAMRPELPARIETEVLAFGRMPLSMSARCFTARSRNLTKDDCATCCIDYPDGRVLSTRDGEPFIALNGVQTLSARSYNLLGELEDMRELGVNVVRISPQSTDMERIVSVYAAALAGEIESDRAQAEIEDLAVGGVCNGYWHGAPGIANAQP